MSTAESPCAYSARARDIGTPIVTCSPRGFVRVQPATSGSSATSCSNSTAFAVCAAAGDGAGVAAGDAGGVAVATGVAVSVGLRPPQATAVAHRARIRARFTPKILADVRTPMLHV